MPKRYRQSTLPFRKVKRRRLSRRKRKSRLYRGLSVANIVPASKLVRLRYCQYITLDPGAGQLNRHVWRANSIFDPNQTDSAGDHKPLGYKEWAVFYDHYTVVSSRIVAKFVSQSDSGTLGNGVCGIILTDSTASLPDLETLTEQPKTSTALLTSSNGIGKVTVSKNFSAKKFFGLQSIKDNRSLIGASMATNPNEDAYFSTFYSSTSAVYNPVAITVQVVIEYLVYYTERKTLTVST